MMDNLACVPVEKLTISQQSASIVKKTAKGAGMRVHGAGFFYLGLTILLIIFTQMLSMAQERESVAPWVKKDRPGREWRAEKPPLSGVSAPVLSSRYIPTHAWGSFSGLRDYESPGSFDGLVGIHADASGRIYTTEEWNDRVQVFDAEGNVLFTFGSYGDGDGEFNYPQGITTDADGNIYVVDAGNFRIQKFDSEGNFITSWGSFGAGAGYFVDPVDIAITSAGLVLVTDGFHSVVQLFDTDGNSIGVWDDTGNGAPFDPFFVPLGIAVDSSDYVYLVDSGNYRVVVFDETLTYSHEFGSSGSGDGEFEFPIGVDVDGGGYIYITDGDRADVQRFENDGTFNTKWGTLGTGDGEFILPLFLAVSPSGRVYVTDYERNCVQRFSSTGTFQLLWGTNNGQPYWGTVNGEFDGPNDAACSPDGYVYISDEENDRIQKFTATGKFVMSWGTTGSADGELEDPEGITCDAAGNVYVADENNDRIQKFAPDGTHLLTIGSFGSGDGEFDDPQDVAVDSDGNIYVVDQDNDRIQKFDSSGTYLTQWGSSGSGDGEFNSAECIAINSKNQIFAGDEILDTIQVFDSGGNFIRTINLDNYDIDGGPFVRSIAFDKFDNLFVVYNPEAVVVLNPSDKQISRFGRYGSDLGEFWYANGICVSANGAVYVVDNDLHRVQRFEEIAVGALKVRLGPQPVEPMGGWRIKGQMNWRPSRDLAGGIPVGVVTVEFQDVEGYVTPAAEMVDIQQGRLTRLRATYLEEGSGVFVGIDLGDVPGGLRDRILWCIDGSGGFYSGSQSVYLSPGTYTIYFKPFPGWFALPVEIVVAESGNVEFSPTMLPFLVGDGFDIDGDGIADLFLLDTNTGSWFQYSANGATATAVTEIGFGNGNSWPVAGDYDGDGRMDIAVWYPERGLWRIQGQYRLEGFGEPGNVPVPADYDGDGLTDPAVYDQISGRWYFALSSTWSREDGDAPKIRKSRIKDASGIPVPGDYDGDGRAEIALYDPETGTWHMKGMTEIVFGDAEDLPVPADYDGDGVTDIATVNMKTGQWRIFGGETFTIGSKDGDNPTAIDIDGDGAADPGWYRSRKKGVWFFLDGSSIRFGDKNSIPISR